MGHIAPRGMPCRAGYRVGRDTLLQACRKVLMLSESEFSLECIDQARSLSYGGCCSARHALLHT
jgi:hypothetical protein